MPVDTEFIEALASSAPTPGGGGASAYCGALATSLASMVGNLTVGKPAYADVADEMRDLLEYLESARAQLVRLIDDDARAFGPVAAVYRMPKDTAEQIQARKAAMEAAIKGACEVPLRIMEVCMGVLEASDAMARKGSRMLRSDAGCAAVLANAAVRSASLSVYVNVACMDDAEQAVRYRERAHRMVRMAFAKSEGVYASVAEQVDPADD